MKMLLSVIIAMSFLFTTYSQRVDSLPDTAKLTLNKVYSDVKSGLQGLGQSLKVPATHVYEILVRQQVTYSIINISIVLGLFLFCLLTAKYAKTTYKGHLALHKLNKPNSIACIEDTAKGPVAVIVGVISVLSGTAGIIVFCATMHETVIGFTNPEYGAIKEIISFVK